MIDVLWTSYWPNIELTDVCRTVVKANKFDSFRYIGPATNCAAGIKKKSAYMGFYAAVYVTNPALTLRLLSNY